MRLRKLESWEHVRTRKLWEAVFSEDSKEFLDYYYFFKARENAIYVIEDQREICSMLHLNPYLLQVNERQFFGNYIVAVATRKKDRGKGFMGSLLKRAMQDMYEQKQPFTFLMPAAEAIYTPYDFRFIYEQEQEKRVLSPVEEAGQKEEEFLDANLSDAGELAAFFQENFAEKYQVYAVRDAAYYQTMLLEQQSEKGGICMLRSAGKLTGMFFYAMEEEMLDIREPLYLPQYEPAFYRAVSLLGAAEKAVKIYGARGGSGKKKPLIMARILHLEKLLACLKVVKGKSMDCSFAVLDSLLKKNSRIWRIRGQSGENISVCETEDSEGVITIGALASLLFGYKTVEEIHREENVIMTAHLSEELKKIEPLKRVFLNEVV